MATALRDEARRLKRLFSFTIGAALAAGQIALPFACSDAGGSGASNAGTGAGSGSGAGAAGGNGPGGSAGDGGPDATDPDADAHVDPCAPRAFVPDAAHDCEEFVHLGCGLPPDASIYPDCYLNIGDCAGACGNPAFNCRVTGAGCVDGGDGGVVADRNAPLDLECAVCLSDDGSVGRVPEGWLDVGRPRDATLGSALARAAELEAASVVAFRRMGAELEAFGAPRSLVAAASRAAADESRHKRKVARLARAFGGAPSRPRIRPTERRSLEAFAIENAVEGCVRETYGALLATLQAERATDPEARDVFASIAAEETRHAALSAAVDAWAARRLGPKARRRVAAARDQALKSLVAHAGRTPSPTGADAIGWPTAAERRCLAVSLVASLAAAA